ncbi:MAG: MmcQ/YjbR family DNA-binding protein [Acidobacteriota bacterium]
MTTDEFRALALSFPETEESSHMDHPDFRVGGKIFATIAPDGMHGMAKLTSDQQEVILRVAPRVFEPASGAWGRKGATMIDLEQAAEDDVRHALSAAWRNTAPKAVLERYD